MTEINLYFEHLLRLLKSVNNKADFDQNQIWLKQYEELLDKIQRKDVACLPNILTLIHPTFLYDQRGYELGTLLEYNKTNFNKGINTADRCQIAQINSKFICHFNSHKEIRGKCQADHLWPHSLGGPSILSNRILLCQYHNVSKSNSIVTSFLKTYPTWINEYLLRMYNLKK